MTRLLLIGAVAAALFATPGVASACAVPPRHPTPADRGHAAGFEGDMWRAAPLVYLATVAEMGEPGGRARLTPTLLLKGEGLPASATMPQGRSICPMFIGPEMAVGDEYVVYAFPPTATGSPPAIFARAADLGDPATREAMVRARAGQAR
jgi:hypothetical protein